MLCGRAAELWSLCRRARRDGDREFPLRSVPCGSSVALVKTVQCHVVLVALTGAGLEGRMEGRRRRRRLLTGVWELRGKGEQMGRCPAGCTRPGELVFRGGVSGESTRWREGEAGQEDAGLPRSASGLEEVALCPVASREGTRAPGGLDRDEFLGAEFLGARGSSLQFLLIASVFFVK